MQILTVAECPNRRGAVELVEQVARELGVEPELELVNVLDSKTAGRLRFLGSPTIRVDGRDVEPGAAARTEYALSCRLYRTAAGVQGQPDAMWIRDALLVRTRPA
ncbi:MAG TPA: hypothetical protein VE261_02455 [Gaiellaceae bacterium]|nr:hypothetical protein [Gaiellaceae bacterium]